MKNLLIIACMVLLASCGPSRSEQLAREPRVKAVVIDTKPKLANTPIVHKIRLLDDNAVSFYNCSHMYDRGDTILIKKSLIRY